MNLIVAVDENWAIGKKNDLLFRIPEDMKFFRKMTLDRAVVCGKNTLFSFPDQKPLPRRHHFVLTHSDLADTEQMTVLHDLDALQEALSSYDPDDVFVIGGGSVYKQLYRKCRLLYVTKIFSTCCEADTFFPNLDQETGFRLLEEGPVQASENGLKYSFCIYQNLEV